MLETSRLMNINVFLMSKIGMDKCSGDVGQGKIQLGCKNQLSMDCRPLNDGSPGLKNVYSFNLHATTNTESCFEFLDETA